MRGAQSAESAASSEEYGSLVEIVDSPEGAFWQAVRAMTGGMNQISIFIMFSLSQRVKVDRFP
jgi:hypothetical protein